MKKFINMVVEDFPWQVFLTGVVLLLLSLWFKAYDMAAVGIIALVGCFIVCIDYCFYSIKTDREIAAHKAQRKARFEAEMEELEKQARERYGII